MNDDAVIVTAEENNILRTENEERKQRLKASKTRLAERQRQLRELGQSVYKGMRHSFHYDALIL